MVKRIDINTSKTSNLSDLVSSTSQASNTQPKQADTKNEFSEIDDALALLIRISKSVERVCEVGGFEVDHENQILICPKCVKPGELHLNIGKSINGVFHYDFSLGTDFTQ